MSQLKIAEPHVNLAIFGDRGHGRAELASAILDFQAQKGLASPTASADLQRDGAAEFKTEQLHYALLDYPDEGSFVEKANHFVGVDGSIVVVSALQGITNLTRQQLIVATTASRNRSGSVVLYLSEAEQVEESALEDFQEELRALAEYYLLVSDPLTIRSGNDKNQTIKSLLDLVDFLSMKDIDAFDRRQPQMIEQAFQVPIRKVLSNQNHGPIIQGIVEDGPVHPGDSVEILGRGERLQATIAQITMFQEPLDEALVGDFVELSLEGIEQNQLQSGMIIVQSGPLSPPLDFVKSFEAKVYKLTQQEAGTAQDPEEIEVGNEASFSTNYEPDDLFRFIIRGTVVTGKIKNADGAYMMTSGGSYSILVELSQPLPLSLPDPVIAFAREAYWVLHENFWELDEDDPIFQECVENFGQCRVPTDLIYPQFVGEVTTPFYE